MTDWREIVGVVKGRADDITATHTSRPLEQNTV